MNCGEKLKTTHGFLILWISNSQRRVLLENIKQVYLSKYIPYFGAPGVL